MKRKRIWFVGPRQLEVRDEELSDPDPDCVLVQVALTGVSAGTEMLVYRGELPDPTAEDVDPVMRGLMYPTPFGYCAVGRVAELGPGIDAHWNDRLVFAFQPHASAYAARPDALLAVPEDVAPQDAVFLANMETAVTLVQDSAPLVGERVLVLGQGTVGLLAASLLHEFPLACLVTADLHAVRRAASLGVGVTATLDPADPDFMDRARSYTQGAGFDLVLELTGNPKALDNAIGATAFSGRIVVGSWYGRQRATLDLGGRFHRSRIRLLASQVSTIAPELSGRWDKKRQYEVAWDAIRRIRPARWITHRFAVDRAGEAFHLLDTAPQTVIQVVLEYGAAR